MSYAQDVATLTEWTETEEESYRLLEGDRGTVSAVSVRILRARRAACRCGQQGEVDRCTRSSRALAAIVARVFGASYY